MHTPAYLPNNVDELKALLLAQMHRRKHFKPRVMHSAKSAIRCVVSAI
jgi:hypothetical protein